MDTIINLFLFSFSFPLLSNIEIKTNNHSKFFPIQREIKMKTKYSFSFLIVTYAKHGQKAWRCFGITLNICTK